MYKIDPWSYQKLSHHKTLKQNIIIPFDPDSHPVTIASLSVVYFTNNLGKHVMFKVTYHLGCPPPNASNEY